MTPGNLPLKNFVNPSGFAGHVGTLRATRSALEDLRTDVMHNRRPSADYRVIQQRLAVITNTGPLGTEVEPPRNLYWAKFQRMEYVDLGDGDGDVNFRDEERPGLKGTVLAKNLGEFIDSHGVRNDDAEYVTISKIVFNAAVPVVRWVFNLVPKPIWIKITAHTQDGTNKRWAYDWEEVSATGVGGHSVWAFPSGGLHGSSSTRGSAYNTVESINGATGTYGNGVSSSNLTGTFALTVVPNNVIVPAWQQWPEDDDIPSYYFNYENAIDGACP